MFAEFTNKGVKLQLVASDFSVKLQIEELSVMTDVMSLIKQVISFFLSPNPNICKITCKSEV